MPVIEFEDDAPTPATEIEFPVPPEISAVVTFALLTVTAPEFVDVPVTAPVTTFPVIEPVSTKLEIEFDDEAPTAAKEMLLEFPAVIFGAVIPPVIVTAPLLVAFTSVAFNVVATLTVPRSQRP